MKPEKSLTIVHVNNQNETSSRKATPQGEIQSHLLRKACFLKNVGGAKSKGAIVKTKNEMGGGRTPLMYDIRKYLVGADHTKNGTFLAKIPLRKGSVSSIIKTQVQSDQDRGSEAWTGSPRGV